MKVEQLLHENFIAAISSQSPLLKNTGKEVNALTRYLQKLDWDQITTTAISKGISLIIITVIFWLVRKIGLRIIRRGFQNFQKKELQSESRVKTLNTLTVNIFQYTLFFFIGYSYLTILGIPVGSLLAGAGIAGVAIGLGAQGFINDLITGFFIILEKQLEVGDFVKIDQIDGNVVAVGIRTTQIKSPDGTIHFIPNHCITIVSNHSRNNMRVMINVRINPEENTEKITKILQEVNQKLKPDYPEIKDGPEILGIADIGGGNLAIQILMYTLNGSQAKVQRDFLTAYVHALSQEGITIPSSPINLV